MKTSTMLCRISLALVCLLPATAPPARGQSATVRTEEGSVVAQPGYVRIEDGNAVVDVHGDWRTAPLGVRVTIDDAALARLGVVEGADLVRLALAGDVLFEVGSALVDETASTLLREVAQLVRERARGEVLFVGHTDTVGSAALNQKLSEARALAVADWLHRREGIPASILLARGMGERQPVSHETTPDGGVDRAGRARNRRVEIFLGTTPGVDVRVAADRVTVATAAGPVVVDDESVEVGGVRVDAGGVQVGGVSVAAGGPVDRGSATAGCAAGRRCSAHCPEGDCRWTCPAGATCDFTCAGGDCELACAAGARCDFRCPGGDCRYSCALGSSCETSCSGGGCRGGA